MSRVRPSVRLGAALGAALVVAGVGLGGRLPVAEAAPSTPQTYVGTVYSADQPAPPAEPENQSRMWFYADAWWALLLDPRGRTVRVHELMPDHTWRPTTAVVNPHAIDVGDAAPDGGVVRVVARQTDGGLYYRRLTFNPATRDYVVDRPFLVTKRGANAPASLVKDSTGMLWVAWATSNAVVLAHSRNDGRDWSQVDNFATTGTGFTPETASLVAFSHRVGLMWSDQNTGSFQFASHRDDDDPSAWAHELALPGPGRPDNYINLRRVPGASGDTLVAAVQTAHVESGAAPETPLLELLVRPPTGVWSRVPISTIGDGLTSPVLAVDTDTQTLHVFAEWRGHLVTKTAPLAHLQFPPGPGQLFMLGAAGTMVEPTVSREPVTARTGVVVLARDLLSRRYRHTEMPIAVASRVPDPADKTAPKPPTSLQARALSPDTVALTWAEATDGDRWSPGRTGVPVYEYLVFRGSQEVARTTDTYVRLRPRGATDTGDGLSVEYQVVSVDFAGNHSEPVRVVVDVPAVEQTDRRPLWIGLGIVGALALAWGALHIRRRRAMRGAVATSPPPEPDREAAELVSTNRR